MDLDGRPELTHGTVDIVVPKEYWAEVPPPRVVSSFPEATAPSTSSESHRPPSLLRTLFIIDVSVSALVTGATRDACQVIRTVLHDEDSRGLVGLMTYNSSLYFYEITVSSSAPLFGR